MNFAIAGPNPLSRYVWRMSVQAARIASRSGSSRETGGSCATRVRTCSGCLATRAGALTAPPLLAKMSTGPASSAVMIRCRSSACSLAAGRAHRPAVSRMTSASAATAASIAASLMLP